MYASCCMRIEQPGDDAFVRVGPGECVCDCSQRTSTESEKVSLIFAD